MAYENRKPHLAFFVPLITLAQNAAEVLKEQDIGAASADHGELICVRPCTVVRCGFTLTSELAGGSSVAPRVVFTKRPTPLSATGEAVVGTVIVPDATAVGKSVYKNVTPVHFAVGDSMEISHVIGTGTPTGQGVYWFECCEDPEVPANNSDMIESA
jgi:hypothetical protein